MPHFPLLPSLVALTIAFTAPARAEEAPTADDKSAALQAAVQRLAEEVNVRSVDYVDYFGHGDYSALVRTDDCEEKACDWYFVASVYDQYGVVGGSSAEELTFTKAEDGSRLLRSDGVYWAWTGTQLIPWGDMLSHVRAYEPSKNDMKHMRKARPEFAKDGMRMMVYTFDPFHAIWNHRLIEVSEGNGAWTDRVTYILMNYLGEVIYEGNHIQRPYIFPTKPGHAVMITNDGHGLAQTELIYGGELRE